MRVSINDDSKIIAVWLNNEENTETNLPKNVSEIVEKYKSKKYKVCMYQSGQDDIKNNFLQLILNNV